MGTEAKIIVRMPMCHPDRKHCAKGLCRECYMKAYRPLKGRTVQRPACHPEKKYRAKGLCLECYSQTWRRNNKKKCRAYCRGFRLRNLSGRRAIDRKRFRKDWAPGEHERAESALPFVKECAACFSPSPRYRKGWAADHDHETGVFRAYLCYPCNLMAGFVENYGMDCGPAISTYLKKFSSIEARHAA